MDIPDDLLIRFGRPAELDRADRRELARELRSLGWSYGEIATALSSPKSTVAGWCRGIALGPHQEEAIRTRTGSVRGVPRDTQWRRRATIEAIRRTSSERFPELVDEPAWVAGIVMYWAEGDKRSNALRMANADPAAHRLFMAWTRRYVDSSARFRFALNLHAGDDSESSMTWWANQLGVDRADFTQPHVKPHGTGHRKNRLPHGVCRTSVRRSADGFQMVSAWIADVAVWVSREGFVTLPSGR